MSVAINTAQRIPSNALRHSRPEIAITQHTFIALAVLVIGIDIVMLVALSI